MDLPPASTCSRAPPHARPGPRRPLERIDLDGVTALHDDGTIGVQDVDLSVARGEPRPAARAGRRGQVEPALGARGPHGAHGPHPLERRGRRRRPDVPAAGPGRARRAGAARALRDVRRQRAARPRARRPRARRGCAPRAGRRRGRRARGARRAPRRAALGWPGPAARPGAGARDRRRAPAGRRRLQRARRGDGDRAVESLRERGPRSSARPPSGPRSRGRTASSCSTRAGSPPSGRGPSSPRAGVTWRAERRTLPDPGPSSSGLPERDGPGFVASRAGGERCRRVACRTLLQLSATSTVRLSRTLRKPRSTSPAAGPRRPRLCRHLPAHACGPHQPPDEESS